MTDVAGAIAKAATARKPARADVAVKNGAAGTDGLQGRRWGRAAAPVAAKTVQLNDVVASGAGSDVVSKTGHDKPFCSRIRAYMVVPAVDFAMMVAPLAWRPPQLYSTLALAVLAILLLTGGTKYTAPMHLSVLDDLPTILTRLLAATAVIATAILYTHQKISV